MMQISEDIFFKKYSLQDFSHSLCGHAGYIGVGVELKFWKKIKFENERG